MKLVPISTVALAALAGCATQEPKSPDVGLTKAEHSPTPPDLGRGATRFEVEPLYNMYVTESVRSVCAGPDPFFAFDTSKPMIGDQPTMKNLVTCMTSGPLKGKTIKLIGHTDRGRRACARHDSGHGGLALAFEEHRFEIMKLVSAVPTLSGASGRPRFACSLTRSPRGGNQNDD